MFRRAQISFRRRIKAEYSISPSSDPDRTQDFNNRLAEREGFEPPVPFQVRRFSRPEPSTSRPPLRLLHFYYSRTDSGQLKQRPLFCFQSIISKRPKSESGFQDRLFQPLTHPSA